MEASQGTEARLTIARAEEEGELKRAIGPKLLLLFIVGDILGGGIYALVGEVGGETGGAIWIAFTLALVMAAFTAGSYAELVSKYPRAGGAGLYVHKAFGNPFFSFIVAFAVAMSGITSAATLSRGFGGDYLSEFVDVEVVLAALALIVLIALVNFRGIAESVKLNVGFTIVEIGGLLLIVLIAVVAVIQGDADTRPPVRDQGGLDASSASALAGAALAFYALIGFEDSVNISEEVKDPTSVYPKVIFGGLRDRRRDLPPGHDRRLGRRADRGPDELVRPSAGGREAGAARDRHEGLLRDRPPRALERRAHQHDHGLAPPLRHVARGRPAQAVRGGPLGPPDAVGRDHLHDARRAPGSSSRPTSRALRATTVALLLIVFTVVNATVLVAAPRSRRPRALPGAVGRSRSSASASRSR